MRSNPLVAIGAVSAIVMGCAASTSSKVTNDEPGAMRWTGSLQPTQQRSSALVVTGQNKAFGSVTIRPGVGTGASSRMHVSLTVALPAVNSQQLRWAIVPDRCGSGDLPVIGFEQFPLIEIGNNGRGEVSTDLPLDLVQNNVYHVNVYDGRGQQLDNVLTCGNLKFESK